MNKLWLILVISIVFLASTTAVMADSTIWSIGVFDDAYNPEVDGTNITSTEPYIRSVGPPGTHTVDFYNSETFYSVIIPVSAYTGTFEADLSRGAKLLVSWSPGRTGKESFTVTLNDVTLVSKQVEGVVCDEEYEFPFPDGRCGWAPPYYPGIKLAYYTEVFDFGAQGTGLQEHTLTIDYNEGNGLGFDYLELSTTVEEEEVECPNNTQPEHRDTVIVQSDGSDALSNAVEPESFYLFEAEGTYVYWEEQLPDAGIADAKYSLRPEGSHNPGPGPQWISGDDLPEPYTHYLEILVNNKSVDWGDFNPEHVYRILFDTREVEELPWPTVFNILDSHYGDNSGNLTVNIYECVEEEPEEPVECPEETEPEYIETLTVPSDGTSVESTDDLESETMYLLKASGTYTYNRAGDWADAEWYLKAGEIVKGDVEGSKPYVLDISINGYDINRDWGAYNEDHEYALLFEGEDDKAEFSIYDSYSGDNQGSLDLEIYKCVGEEEPGDADNDTVNDDEDLCPDTVPDSEMGVPREGLGVNRLVWEGVEEGWITNKGNPNVHFTIEDTKGCNCAQILNSTPGRKEGHWKFGCSIGLIRSFIEENS